LIGAQVRLTLTAKNAAGRGRDRLAIDIFLEESVTMRGTVLRSRIAGLAAFMLGTLLPAGSHAQANIPDL
jgi:hypothetical protein